MRHLVAALAAILASCVLATAAPVQPTGPAAEILALTGRCTRIVWIRSSGGVGHPFGPFGDNKAPTWRIMALDTHDGGQERVLVGEPGTYHHVMITPRGNRVIWSDCEDRVWICDWDGRNRRKLLDAKLAVGVAEDPPGVEWVYVHGGNTVRASNADQIGSIVRHRIDDISKKELVWDKTGSNDKWEFTRDGKFGASGLPWPHAGIASLPNGEFRLVGDGCTPGIAHDASLVMHMKATGHSGIFIYNADGSGKRYIDFRSQAPGIDGVPDPQFWWTSFARYDKRFFTFSGPHPSMGYKQSKGNIYFCMFNERFDGVARWVQVTNYPEVETHPYAWIGNPNSAPRIVAHPADQTVDEGARVVFTVVAEGSPEPAYQWQQNGAAIPGATGSTLELQATRAANGARIRCVVSNSEGRATSKEARLSVNLKGPSPEQLAEWDAKLLARVRDALSSGGQPVIGAASGRRGQKVVSAGPDGTLRVQAGPGVELGMPLGRLGPDEKAVLALSVLKAGDEACHALAGFYLMLAGRGAEAESHLARAGAAAEAVRALFR